MSNYSISAPTLVKLTPLSHGYGAVTAGLAGDVTYALSGSGGWQTVDRPKLVGATQWMDRAPFQLQMDLILDHSVTKRSIKTASNTTPSSVETECRRIESWLDKVQGKLMPTIIRISGPMPGVEKLWVLSTAEFGEAIRDLAGGFRVQQKVKVTFLEYSAPLRDVLGQYKYGPSQDWRDTYNTKQNTGTQSYAQHTVKQGETLAKIANIYYHGDPKAAARIAKYNNLQDPRAIVPGQVLILPR